LIVVNFVAACRLISMAALRSSCFWSSSYVAGSGKKKKEIPYKRTFEGHRVHNGYTILSLNPKMIGWVTSVSNTRIYVWLPFYG
jgi:hypothetical protein